MSGIGEGDLVPDDCTEFCTGSADDNNNQYKVGAPLCCQFEFWDDGSQSCYLYMGEKTLAYEGGEGDVKSMTFFYGDNAASLVASAALLAVAALY